MRGNHERRFSIENSSSTTTTTWMSLHLAHPCTQVIPSGLETRIFMSLLFQGRSKKVNNKYFGVFSLVRADLLLYAVVHSQSNAVRIAVHNAKNSAIIARIARGDRPY